MANQRQWKPTYRPFPREWAEHPRKRMLMTPVLVFVGGIFAFWVTAFMAAILQIIVFYPKASNEWAPMMNRALEGRQFFTSNGCLYCHSGFTRPQDIRNGVHYLYTRVSLPGDYFGQENSPNLFGTARLGPDLSNEGGFHPDDWHRAHYFDARFVDPLSIMPSFSFFGDPALEKMIAFVQTRSGKSGLLRYAGQIYSKKLILASQNLRPPPKGFAPSKTTLAQVHDAQLTGPAPPNGNVDGLDFPDPINLNNADRLYWLADNPLPITKDNLLRGREVFQERCIGCHGEGGSATSFAAAFMAPTPINFTSPDDAANGNDTAPGVLYFRVLRGVDGSAMENFGTRLRVDDIWRVVMFLKTIPSGGLQAGKLPTVDMYIQWRPPSTLLQYIGKHPIDKNRGFVAPPGENQTSNDPFVAEFERVYPGLAGDDRFVLPGYGEVSIKAGARDIKRIYLKLLNGGWTDLESRDEVRPPGTQKNIPPELTRELR